VEKRRQRIFYSRYDKPDEKNKLRSQVYNHKLFFHKLGTPQSRDKLIYERPIKRNGFSVLKSPTMGAISSFCAARHRSKEPHLLQKPGDPKSKVVEL